MILTFGDLASELGISSRPWLSRAYLSPLMMQGSYYFGSDLFDNTAAGGLANLETYAVLREEKVGGEGGVTGSFKYNVCTGRGSAEMEFPLDIFGRRVVEEGPWMLFKIMIAE